MATTNKAGKRGSGKSHAMPELLGSRADLEHSKYGAGDPVYDLFGVSIRYSNSGTHTINAPTENSPTARKLRRFGLALSRFSLPNEGDKARKLSVPKSTVRAASRAAGAAAYTHTFGDDLTNGVLSDVQFVNSIKAYIETGSGSRSALIDLLSMAQDEKFVSGVMVKVYDMYAGTKHEGDANQLLAVINSVAGGLRDYRLHQSAVQKMEQMNRPKGHWSRRQGIDAFNELIRALEYGADRFERWAQEHAQRRVVESEQKPDKPERIASIVHSDNWETLIVAKPMLTVSHTGKLGRRTVATNEGKYPRYIERLVTDPERRMFTRRTRSLGAVVVLDCSGSMGWDDEQLDRLISACAGATVLAYSSDRNPTTPNAWVVAKRNQRVKHLPDFPGGNGVDGPAIMWAIRNLRYSSSSPVIWVSDGQVTGKYDASSGELRREVKQICQKYGVLVAEDADTAIRLVKRLQGKTR